MLLVHYAHLQRILWHEVVGLGVGMQSIIKDGDIIIMESRLGENSNDRIR